MASQLNLRGANLGRCRQAISELHFAAVLARQLLAEGVINVDDGAAALASWLARESKRIFLARK